MPARTSWSFRIGDDLHPRMRHANPKVQERWFRNMHMNRQRKTRQRQQSLTAGQLHSLLGCGDTVPVPKLPAQLAAGAAATKTARLVATAASTTVDDSDAPRSQTQTVHSGQWEVRSLVAQQKAKLVLIADDASPIEQALCLPALCRVMEVPFMFVGKKTSLGQLVHQKTAAVVALTDLTQLAARARKVGKMSKKHA